MKKNGTMQFIEGETMNAADSLYCHSGSVSKCAMTDPNVSYIKPIVSRNSKKESQTCPYQHSAESRSSDPSLESFVGLARVQTRK